MNDTLHVGHKLSPAANLVTHGRLLHQDIDEVWYSPLPHAQGDAPSVFADVPADVGVLHFNNHEAVHLSLMDARLAR